MGLFGFRESIAASFVVQSLAVETITALALLTWTILVSAAHPGPRAAGPPPGGKVSAQPSAGPGARA